MTSKQAPATRFLVFALGAVLSCKPDSQVNRSDSDGSLGEGLLRARRAEHVTRILSFVPSTALQGRCSHLHFAEEETDMHELFTHVPNIPPLRGEPQL